jgi:hypothetical protein
MSGDLNARSANEWRFERAMLNLGNVRGKLLRPIFYDNKIEAISSQNHFSLPTNATTKMAARGRNFLLFYY